MEYTLTGFRQDGNIRMFVFQGVTPDRRKAIFVVGADITLISKHAIPIQELPLLCRRLLEDRGEDADRTRLMFTEKHMLDYVTRKAAAQQASDQRRKPHRRPPRTTPLGQAWR
jgi:hypothetical protein